MKQFERCDPARLDLIKAESKIAKAACDRWVDNLFVVTDWMKKGNSGLQMDQLEEAFPVLKDLDYLEYK